MHQEKRLRYIKEYLAQKGELTTNDLIELLKVSKDTVRRDILLLTERGEVKRTHGGIVSLDFDTHIPSYEERLIRFSKVKIKMAEAALKLIEEQDICFFDVSTTMTKLSQLVNINCSIYTHSIDNSIAITNKMKPSLNLLGGDFYSRNRFFYEPDQIKKLNSISFDIVFIGAASISSHGVFFEDKEDAWIKSAAIKNAKKVVLVAESEKFKKSASFKGNELEDIDIFITDSPLSNEQLSWFKENIEILLVSKR